LSAPRNVVVTCRITRRAVHRQNVPIHDYTILATFYACIHVIRGYFTDDAERRIFVFDMRDDNILVVDRSKEWSMVSDRERQRLGLVISDDGEFW